MEAAKQITITGKVAAIKSLPARFDASGLRTQQYFATSKDGTRIPYFVTRATSLPGMRGKARLLLTDLPHGTSGRALAVSLMRDVEGLARLHDGLSVSKLT